MGPNAISTSCTRITISSKIPDGVLSCMGETLVTDYQVLAVSGLMFASQKCILLQR